MGLEESAGSEHECLRGRNKEFAFYSRRLQPCTVSTPGPAFGASEGCRGLDHMLQELGELGRKRFCWEPCNHMTVAGETQPAPEASGEERLPCARQAQVHHATSLPSTLQHPLSSKERKVWEFSLCPLLLHAKAWS